MIYEFRTYVASPGKLSALLDRFRDHTIGLFDKHGIQSIGYWTSSEKGEEDLLTYIVAFIDEQQRERAWAALREDPERIAIFEATDKGGKLVAQTSARVMTPTAFSQLQ